MACACRHGSSTWRRRNLVLGFVEPTRAPDRFWGLSSDGRRFAQQGRAKRHKIQELDANSPSESETNAIKFEAYKRAVSEMGQDTDGDQMMRRVEELTTNGIKEAFPKAFEDPSKHKQRYGDSDDIWENGTVVRYMARILAVLLAITGVYAFRDQFFSNRAHNADLERKTK